MTKDKKIKPKLSHKLAAVFGTVLESVFEFYFKLIYFWYF
jgi:hypothetical protein